MSGRTSFEKHTVRSALHGLLVIVVALGLSVAESSDRPPAGMADLPEGGAVVGTLEPTTPGVAEHDCLPWQAAHFHEPFPLRIDAIFGLRFEAADPPPPAGPIRVHLRGGDILSGVLQGFDAEHVTLRRTGSGGQRVRIDRRWVESIAKPGAGGGSFDGPGGLAGWETTPAGSWRDEAGRLVGGSAGSAISRDVGSPPRARFDLTLSWRTRPELRVILRHRPDGLDGDVGDAAWLEILVVEGRPRMMLARREGRRAALTPLPVDLTELDRLRIVLFYDQEEGRLAALVPVRGPEAGDGATLAEVSLSPETPIAAEGRFRLQLNAGDVCLESLRVSTWQAQAPSLDDLSGTVITTGGERITDARVEGFEADATGGTWVIGRGDTVWRLSTDEVDDISFATSPPPTASEFSPIVPSRPSPPAMLRVVMTDGDRVSGELSSVDGHGIRISRAGIDQPVLIESGHLAVVQGLGSATEMADLPGRLGTLGGDVGTMRGVLVDAGEVVPGATGLAWWPLGADRPARLAGGEGFTATLDYVATDPSLVESEDWVGGVGGVVTQDADGRMLVAMLSEDGAAARDGRLQAGDRIVAVRPVAQAPFVATLGLDTDTVMNLMRGRVGTVVALRVENADGGGPREIELSRGAIGVFGREVLEQALRAHARFATPAQAAGVADQYPAMLFLRDGDVVPCRVDRIDPDGVDLETPLGLETAASRRVPAALVQAVELVPSAASRILDAARVERLLTVPRSQRTRPPTHLLRLLDGDYLRGRLVSLDASTARIEILGSIEEVPRSDVARVIWLHADPEDGGRDAVAADPGVGSGGAATTTGPVRVRAEWSDGKRLSLDGDGVADGWLTGTHRGLGRVRVPLEEIDRLRLGGAVSSDAAERPYARWTPRPAPEPRSTR
jgi:hypothetical protein